MPPFRANSLDVSIHGRPNVVPLQDALDLSVHGLKHALDFTCHSTAHPTHQNEFDAILAAIEERQTSDVDLDEVMALFDEYKEELPLTVVEFVESRLDTFSRNVSFVQGQMILHTEALRKALAEEDEDATEVIRGFMKDRMRTFYQNMGTLSLLLTSKPASEG